MRATADEYFTFVESAWTAASAAIKPVTQHYRIAGCRVAVTTVGAPLLTTMMPAFAHLQMPPPSGGPSDLSIQVWDCASTGVPMPTPPADVALFTARGEMIGFGSDRLRGGFQPFGQILSLLDIERRLAIVCVPDAAALESFNRALPLRAVFGWFLPLHDRLLVHASSVGTEHGGVLIVGAAGAGKSNTAVGSLAAGLRFAADDFCAVSTSPRPAVHSLYCTSRIQAGDWAAPPFPRSNQAEPPSEKDLHYLNRLFPDRVCAGYPLRAILIPRRGGTGAPRLQPVSTALTAAQLAFPSVSMIPNADRAMLQRLMAFARLLPAYQLELGSSPKDIPPLISRLIAEHAVPSGASAVAG